MRKFNLMDMFSIVDGRLSYSGMSSVFNVLEFISGYEGISTTGLLFAMDSIRANKPSWWYIVEEAIQHCKNEVGNDFDAIMEFIENKYNPEFEITKLK